MFLLRLNINWERQRCLSITSSSSTVISAYRLAEVTFAILSQRGIQSIPTFSSGCSNKYWALLEDNLPVIFSSYDPYIWCWLKTKIVRIIGPRRSSQPYVVFAETQNSTKAGNYWKSSWHLSAISMTSERWLRGKWICPLSLRKLRRT